MEPYIQYMYSYPHKTAYRALEGVRLEDWLWKLERQENSLYFHVPFCQYKCGYCNLFSVTGQEDSYMERYLDAVERQAEQIAGKMPSGIVFSDLTVGGGTPLLLPEKMLGRLFRLARDYFSFETGKRPIVVETSPGQTSREKLELLKEEGVTRVSIGVQSFLEEELKRLNRMHSVSSARDALRILCEAGFPCVNVDLIYGICGQTRESFLYSLQCALSYQPQEMFVYPLYVKQGTYLHRQGTKPSGNRLELYDAGCEYLSDKGYRQESMRRFVWAEKWEEMPEGRCGFSNTLSLGCGGRSYLGNLHFCSPYVVGQKNCLKKLSDYMQTKDYLKVVNGFILSPEEQKRRYVIRHLLYGRGVSLQEYREAFGADVTQDFPELIGWQQEGYVVCDDSNIGLTKDGMRLSDYLGPKLMSEEVRLRMGESLPFMVHI